MSSPTPDHPKRLGDRSLAEVFRGSNRIKLARELSLWLVAMLSAGAGALGMQVGGGWGWSFLYFAVALVVLMLVRFRVMKALVRRADSATAAALEAERRSVELAAERAREERARERAARRKDTGPRAHKPRANPYRRKDA